MSRQLEDHVRRRRVLAELAVHPGPNRERTRVAHLVHRHQLRPARRVRVERLAHGEGRRSPLPVAGADVVDDREPRDHLERPRGGDVLAAPADHHGQLPLVVDGVRDRRQQDRVAGSADRRPLLVEPVLELGRLPPEFGHVVPVVHADGQDGRGVRDGCMPADRLDRVARRTPGCLDLSALQTLGTEGEQLAHGRRQRPAGHRTGQVDDLVSDDQPRPGRAAAGGE